MRIAYLAILAAALPFAAVAQSMPSGQAIDSDGSDAASEDASAE
jgi:hypothetical protein